MICYDDYPIRILILNLIELLLALVVGVLLVAQLGWWAVLSYAAVGCLGLILALAYGCTRCFYYGRVCGLGLGKMAARIFHQRDEEEFGQALSQTVAWTLVGLVLALPVAAGLVSLSTHFSAAGLAMLVVFLVLIVVIVLTHSRYVCGHCRQARDSRCTLGRMAGLS
ncbi:MAG TPA: hypothetical protein VMW58_07390 [Anaerolineae bacterium]|nr:hypothetical protein [Anaerolineae bacterium]